VTCFPTEPAARRTSHVDRIFRSTLGQPGGQEHAIDYSLREWNFIRATKGAVPLKASAQRHLRTCVKRSVGPCKLPSRAVHNLSSHLGAPVKRLNCSVIPNSTRSEQPGSGWYRRLRAQECVSVGDRNREIQSAELSQHGKVNSYNFALERVFSRRSYV
jgi:hypothetical protein